jgi:hypothetical protein
MNVWNERLNRVLIVVAIAMLAACATGPSVVTNSDPGADWTQYRTFGFFDPLGTDRGGVRSLASQQLRASTQREMQAAGFRLAERDPDLLIDFFISTRETLQTRPSSSVGMHHSRGRYRTWSGWSYSASTTEVVQRTEGTLAVSIVDRARNQMVWEGAASQRVSSSTRENQSEVLDTAIAEIFARFP